jgi:hypothetical protein
MLIDRTRLRLVYAQAGQTDAPALRHVKRAVDDSFVVLDKLTNDNGDDDLVAATKPARDNAADDDDESSAPVLFSFARLTLFEGKLTVALDTDDVAGAAAPDAHDDNDRHGSSLYDRHGSALSHGTPPSTSSALSRGKKRAWSSGFNIDTLGVSGVVVVPHAIVDVRSVCVVCACAEH